MTGILVVSITGAGFIDTCVVNQDGNPIGTIFVSSTLIRGNVDTDSLTAGTPAVITVTRDTETSNALNLTVT